MKCNSFIRSASITSRGKGIKIIEHPQALKLLSKHGADVDFDNMLVRFPKDMIEQALRVVPRSLTMASKNGNNLLLPHPNGLFYVRGASGVSDYFDPESNAYRSPTKADIAIWAQITEALGEIDICLYLSASDVPPQTVDVYGLRILLENTSKHIMIQPFSFGSLKYLFQLAEVAAEGQGLKKNPIVSIWPTPLSPFCLKDMDMEVVIQACRYGVPLVPATLPSTGGTSPITIAGTVLQSGIEILAIIVMSQLLSPGHPVIGLPLFFTLDMLTGRDLCGNVESALGSAASAQFVREAFHIPSATWAFGTDSYLSNGQAGIEKTMGTLLIAEAGCDILAGAGFLDVGKACSPVQLVIDNDLTSVIKRAISGVKVDNETLAWKEILDIKPGGNYLERPHTLQHCHDALRTSLFASKSKETWLAEGSKDLYASALERYKEIRKQIKPSVISPEVKEGTRPHCQAG